MRKLIDWLLAALESAASKGKSDMTDLVAAAASVAGDIDALGRKMEDVVESALVGAGNAATTQQPAAAPAQSVAASDDKFFSILKTLITVGGAEPKAFDPLVALAKAKTVNADLDATIGRLKLLLPISGTALIAFDEAVAAAKAIVA